MLVPGLSLGRQSRVCEQTGEREGPEALDLSPWPALLTRGPRVASGALDAANTQVHVRRPTENTLTYYLLMFMYGGCCRRVVIL